MAAYMARALDYARRVVTEQPGVAIAAVAASVYCTVKLVNGISTLVVFGTLSKLDQTPSQYEAGIVYLHMFPRSVCRQHANMSPFGIKVEAFLRFHKIPHKVVETFKPSSKTNQIPYITLDGEEVHDSSNIIKYLVEKYKLDSTEGLNEEQQAISHYLCRLVDESLSWTTFCLRYCMIPDFYNKCLRLPVSNYGNKIFNNYLKHKVAIRMNKHGIGRKSIKEVGKIGAEDIKAISLYLGNKKFMFGDKVTKADFAVFAHLSQIVYPDIEFPTKEALRECINIRPYLDRVKAEVYPDWDSLVNMALFPTLHYTV